MLLQREREKDKQVHTHHIAVKCMVKHFHYLFPETAKLLF